MKIYGIKLVQIGSSRSFAQQSKTSRNGSAVNLDASSPHVLNASPTDNPSNDLLSFLHTGVHHDFNAALSVAFSPTISVNPYIHKCGIFITISTRLRLSCSRQRSLFIGRLPGVSIQSVDEIDSSITSGDHSPREFLRCSGTSRLGIRTPAACVQL